jgi:16S rRNA (cytosine1402-N4)-methyltransferase
MRMNPQEELTAAEIVNTWSESDLGTIFRDYGEEKKWRAAARMIVSCRSQTAIQTTSDLVKVLAPLFPFRGKKNMHPMTLIFQALRICVNRELEVLEAILPQAIELLAPGKRMGVISFHSLEDRIVKNAFRFAASDKYNTHGFDGVFIDKKPTVSLVTRKALIPSEEEINNNPRSRSAKLRFIEKLP